MTSKSPPVNVHIRGLNLNDLETRRIERQLRRLARRLAHEDVTPSVDLRLTRLSPRQEVEAQLRVQEGHLAPRHAADATADTADKSVRIVVSRLERQLLRRDQRRRGTASYGVPSRQFRERSRLSRALGGRVATAEREQTPADATVGTPD